ncbi:MAG TPA: hypothetical protein VIR31_03865, partial [Nitrososphaeraceae archaeon]
STSKASYGIDITYLILSRTVFGQRYLFSEYYYPTPLIYDMKGRWVQIQLNFLSNRWTYYY